MKQIILLTILILSFSFVLFAQDSDAPLIPENCHLDSFGRIDKNSLFIRLESITQELKANSTAEAFITIEFDTKDSRKKKVALLQMFNQYFDFRKIDRKRFNFIISVSNRELTTLGVIFNTNKSATNYLHNNQVLIKGENLRQAINTIFKKN